MNITLTDARGDYIHYKHLIFAGGEQHIKLLPQNNDLDKVLIELKYRQDSDIVQLCLIVDALRRTGAENLTLFVPYFPGARQDRVCDAGEALSVKVYADIINNLKFKNVIVVDPHSEVTPALINNVIVKNNHDFIAWVVNHIIEETKTDKKDFVLVSPDAGSNKKIYDLNKNIGPFVVVRCDKLRDVTNGKIIDSVIYAEDLTGKTMLIVDDICSYGGSFKGLAKKLKEKNAKQVYLAVTHFEGVANLREMKESGIDGIFTTNSREWGENDYDKNHFVRIIPLSL